MSPEDDRIELTCHKCQRRLRAKPSTAGKRVRCPACSEVLLIPDEEPLVELESAEPPQEAPVAAENFAPAFDIGGLLDEAEQDAAKQDDETTCLLCGGGKEIEARFCTTCTAEQESGVRHASLNEPTLIDTGDGILIDELLLLRDDSLCWRGGSRQRQEIADFDWEIEKIGHLAGVTQMLMLHVRLKGGETDSIQLAVGAIVIDGSSLVSLAVTAAGSQASSEHFGQETSRVGPICAKLLMWLNGGTPFLRRKSHIKNRPGYDHRIDAEATPDAKQFGSFMTRKMGFRLE